MVAVVGAFFALVDICKVGYVEYDEESAVILKIIVYTYILTYTKDVNG